MSQPEQLTFTLTPVGEVTGIDISDLVYGISLETNEHGDGDCRVMMNDAYDHEDVLFRANSRLVVSDSQGTVYMGRLEVPANEAQPGYARITHTFRGYASSADDQIYSASLIFADNYAIDQIFEQTLDELCPDIQRGDIDAGRNLPERSQDFILSSAQNIWNTIAPLGGDSIPLQWQVYSLDGEEIPKLWVQPRPTAAEYYTSMAAGNFFAGNPLPGGTRVTVSGDLRQVYNAVAVKIASGELASGCACVTVHDHNSQSNTSTGVGVLRMAPLDLSSKVGLELTDALEAGNMLLSQLSTLRSSGTEMTLNYPQYILGAASAHVPLWRVRAGKIIKVVDLESGDFLLGNELYIVSTRWEEPSRRLSLRLGQRQGISEAIGRSLRARRPGRADVAQSDPVPEIGREPRQSVKYDIVPHPGETNRDVPYAPARHHHGTPNGDITMTYGIDGVGSAIETPAQTAIGLIRGTMLTWKIRCNIGGLIKYRLSFPPGLLILPGVEDPIQLPGGVVFAEGSNGTLGTINIECLTNTEVDIEVQGVPTATWASLILFGTRNLIFSDPLTPLEAGTGAE